MKTAKEQMEATIEGLKKENQIIKSTSVDQIARFENIIKRF
jgi:hypothetical protein